MGILLAKAEIDIATDARVASQGIDPTIEVLQTKRQWRFTLAPEIGYVKERATLSAETAALGTARAWVDPSDPRKIVVAYLPADEEEGTLTPYPSIRFDGTVDPATVLANASYQSITTVTPKRAWKVLFDAGVSLDKYMPNAHVINAPDQKVEITYAGGAEFDLKVVKASNGSDEDAQGQVVLSLIPRTPGSVPDDSQIPLDEAGVVRVIFEDHPAL